MAIVQVNICDEMRGTMSFALCAVQTALVSWIALVVGIVQGIPAVGAFDESREYLLCAVIVTAFAYRQLFLRPVPLVLRIVAICFAFFPSSAK